MSWEIRQGDALERLREMPDESVQCCVTSPPYWGLRDYGQSGQLGLEATPEEFVVKLVEVLAEVRRVLSDDGTLWLNLGDSYAGGGCGARDPERWPKQSRNDHMATHAKGGHGCKAKDLVGIPWMVAFALRADGWYLRSDIIWSKPNPMPESVTDRPTKAHEYLFLLSKSPRYLYDAGAIREVGVWPGQNRSERGPRDSKMPGAPSHAGLRQEKRRSVRPGVDTKGGNQGNGTMTWTDGSRNKRSVWSISPKPYAEAHFATFPPDLVEPCILAGSMEQRNEGECVRVNCTVLDPFCGAATTGLVATRLGRDFIGIELNPEYVELGRNRIRDDAPLLNHGAEVAA